MKFSGEQLAAIYKIANCMVMADGRVDEKELACLVAELVRFNVTPEEEKALRNLANSMEPAQAFDIISKLDYEGKKYVASYLGTIMAIDGDINDKELLLWSFVSTVCGLPTMSVADAILNMSKL